MKESGSGSRISVLVTDSNRLVAEALAESLGRWPDLSIQSLQPTSAAAAVRAAVSEAPDVVLLDSRFSDGSGAEAARSIRKLRPVTKPILLSWYHGIHDIEEALDAGAVGFFPKSMNLGEVAEGIRRAHSGESPVFIDQLEKLFAELAGRADRASAMAEKFRKLTPRELQVLTLLSLDKSIKEVATELEISVSGVRMHISNMLRKTDSFSHAEVLAKARSCGLLRT